MYLPYGQCTVEVIRKSCMLCICMKIVSLCQPENPSASSSDFEDDVEQQHKVNISLFTTSPEVVHTFPVVEIRDSAEYHRYATILLYYM